VADRVVMAAARIVLEPIFEPDFLPTRYGFRPRLSADRALEPVRQTVTWGKKVWALDADIQAVSTRSTRRHVRTARTALFRLLLKARYRQPRSVPPEVESWVDV
jgi:retron-type reverse transcriptase